MVDVVVGQSVGGGSRGGGVIDKPGERGWEGIEDGMMTTGGVCVCVLCVC